jgi:tRNA threonylcarbamoyladenosine biosynthesis protein TsaE
VNLSITTVSAVETQELGLAIGASLTSGPLLILLAGDYGTGKTTFVQALAQGMGIEEQLRSPSYLLAKSYHARQCKLVHADMYRIHSAAQVQDLALDELAGETGVIAVEWPGDDALLVLRGWPMLRLCFEADQTAPDTRRIELSWSPDCPERMVEVLHAAAAG